MKIRIHRGQGCWSTMLSIWDPDFSGLHRKNAQLLFDTLQVVKEEPGGKEEVTLEWRTK